MHKDIIFTDTADAKGLHLDFAPRPASEFIPEWYKQMQNYTNITGVPDNNGAKGTIKKCMPVFDAISSGYIITTFVDIWVKHIPGQPSYYLWKSGTPIQFHPNSQVNTHFSKHSHDFPKLVNPWSIKTPKGYSTLFIPPMHRSNVISIFPGVVDTDRYSLNVEFPFLLTDPEFEGLIPAGTPVAQIIPFKREGWKMGIGGSKETIENEKIKNTVNSRFYNVYKTLYRTKKEYK
jgi:hypothetical protein